VTIVVEASEGLSGDFGDGVKTVGLGELVLVERCALSRRTPHDVVTAGVDHSGDAVATRRLEESLGAGDIDLGVLLPPIAPGRESAEVNNGVHSLDGALHHLGIEEGPGDPVLVISVRRHDVEVAPTPRRRREAGAKVATDVTGGSGHENS
jgi:dihydroxyacetone kinase